MRFIGILLIDALILIALFFGSNTLKGKTAGEVIGTYFVGLAFLYGWSIALYYAVLIFIRG